MDSSSAVSNLKSQDARTCRCRPAFDLLFNGRIDRDFADDQSAGVCGLNLQAAPKLAKTLPHLLYSGVRPMFYVWLPLKTRRNTPLPVVFDLESHIGTAAFQTNAGGLASRVVCDVGETLLDHAKEVGLHLARESPDFARNRQLNLDPASLGETFHIPAQCRNDSEIVQRRRLK